MCRNISLILVVLVTALSDRLFAQYGTVPDHTPLPPNAAALYKVFEKPPGTYTGVPPISIPLYTVSYQGVEVPIRLDYNASGIKVEEMAGIVGLGFNLSVGGSIVRLKNGLADDNQYNGWLNKSFKPSQFTGSTQQLYDYTDGFLDMEPDIYMYSFNGHSGRFAFDENKQLLLLEKPADLRIEKITDNTNAITGFVITDENGYVYNFGASTMNIDGETFYSSWALTNIKNRNGDVLASFQYVSNNYAYQTRGITFISKFFAGLTLGCTAADYAGSDINKNVTAYESTISQVEIGGKKMIFSYTGRLDRLLGYGIKLSKIEIKDADNKLVKEFHFNYDYFISAGATSGTNDPDDLYKRLKLLNVSEHPAAGTDSLTYSFTYDENNLLPQRLSAAVDYWGFYNFANGNSSFIPNGLYTYGNTIGIGDQGERRTNHSVTSANTLTKITNPVGGYREFTYEGNTVLYDEYYKQENLYCDAVDHTTQYFDSDDFDNSSPMSAPALTQNFTVSSDYGAALFYWNMSGFAYDFFVRIVDLNGSYETTLTEFNNELTYGNYAVPNGNYRLEVYYDTYGDFSHIYAWWDELSMSSDIINRYGGSYRKSDRKVGGLRVKRIDDYDPVTAKHHYTDFSYTMPGDSTLTSGVLISLPRILYRASCTGRDCELMRISSSSAYPLNSDDGSYVVYPFVTVKESGNGRTDYCFSFIPDETYDFFAFPPAPAISHRPWRGQLIYKNHYNEAGTLIQRDSTGYHWRSADYVVCYGLRLAVYEIEEYNSVYCTNTTYPYPVWIPQPETSWSTRFTADGNYQTKTEYTYLDNLGRGGINKMKVTGSDGNATTTWYRYPYNSNSDFRLPLSAPERVIKDTLLYYNVLKPIETTTYVNRSSDSVFMGGTKLSYDFFSNDLELKNIKNFTGFSDSATINFSNYDAAGNMREVYTTNNVKQVYLWGYDNKYVVVKVTGSDYNTVASLVNQSVLNSPSSEAAMRTELDKIHNGLAGSAAQVATYTYDTRYGISSMKDPSGKLLTYLYDAHGRLAVVKDQAGKVVKKYCYNYQGQSVPCSLYGNVAKSGNYTRNNCSSGYVGSTVTYTVAANTYFANSQSEADAIAQNDMNMNGQAYANANGSCTQVWYNAYQSGNFTRNDCGSGYTGSTETYDVAANTYSSTVSQAAADALAVDDVNANGQNYANTNGTCTPDGIDVYYQKNSYTYYPVYFTFTDLYTYEQYNFETPWGYYPYNDVLGQLPPGVYEVEIYNPYNYGYHYYETNCYDYTYGYEYAYFYYIYIDEYCNTINIDY